MAIPYVGSVKSQCSTLDNPSPSPFFGWLGSLMNEWRKWRDMRATQTALDEMSDGQLEEIGVRRVSRSAMWLDCRESPLSMEFHYRSALRERGLDV